MEQFKNPDGTYNGIKAMASFSGLSEDEVRWTFDRVKELKSQGISKDEVTRIIKEENPFVKRP